MGPFKTLSVTLFLCSALAWFGTAQAQVVITQTRATQGGVTTGDAPGFPVSITVSGSYVLGGNLSPGTNLDAILVTAPDVTIDLNGYKLSGGPAGGANNARYGVNGQSDRLTVKNGTIASFKGGGVYAPSRPYVIVENLRVVTGGGTGVTTGDIALIRNSLIAVNIGSGINCGRSCHAEGNIVSNNGQMGIRITTGMALGNTVFSNGSYGLWASAFDQDAGMGNNTIAKNYGGNGVQVMGGWVSLQPNMCNGLAC